MSDFDLKEALMMLKDFYKKQAEYTNAIKNQNRMIDSLSHEIEDLKKRITELEANPKVVYRVYDNSLGE